jgi:hypothetical protein
MIAAAALVQRLETAGSDLSADLGAQIVARRGETLPLLLQVLAAHSMSEVPGAVPLDACGDCGREHDDRQWARLHAVDLLTEIGAPIAIDAMLNVLLHTASDEPIHDKIIERLPRLGEALLEPILAALERTPERSDAAESLCCMLPSLGLRDGRITRALLQLLKTRARAAAVYLAEYGDASACPALLEIIAAQSAADDDARLEWLDLVEAYTALGGKLPESIQSRLAAIDA